MSRSRATTEYHTGSTVAADFMERVADEYEELDRYASLAVRWGWGFYLRWRCAHEAEVRQPESRAGRRAFGFHSPEALVALAMLSLGGLCPSLPGRVTLT